MIENASRRTFLRQSVIGGCDAAASSSFEPLSSPNEKLVVGLIGCGGRGVHDAGLFRKIPNVEVAWVCDVDETRRLEAAKNLGVESYEMPSATCGEFWTKNRSIS